MRKWIIAGVIVVLMLLVCAASGAILLFGIRNGVTNISFFNQLNDLSTSVTETEERSFAVTSSPDAPASVEVSTPFGNIDVVGYDGDTVEMVAEKTAYGMDEASAQAAMERIKLIMTQEENRISIKVDTQRHGMVINNTSSSSVAFTLRVPRNTVVIMDSDSGSLSLTGTQVKAGLDTDFGDVTVSDITGGLAVNTSSGSITVADIGLREDGNGDVNLNSEFGDISVQNVVTTTVLMSSGNGRVELDQAEVSGKVTLNSEFGDVSFRGGSAAEIDIQAGNGTVTLIGLDVAKDVFVRGQFGSYTVEDVTAAAMDMSTDSGEITVEGAHGAMTLNSEFGAIRVTDGDQATLQLSTNSGDIHYQGSLGEGPHKLDTEFGDVVLELPSDSAFGFDLTTEFGTISSEFEIQINGAPNEKHWKGTVNDGDDLLTAETDSGNVTLKIVDVERNQE